MVVETIGRIRREHLVQGKSIKAIARTLRLSRNTVRKVLRADLHAARNPPARRGCVAHSAEAHGDSVAADSRTRSARTVPARNGRRALHAGSALPRRWQQVHDVLRLCRHAAGRRRCRDRALVPRTATRRGLTTPKSDSRTRRQFDLAPLRVNGDEFRK